MGIHNLLWVSEKAYHKRRVSHVLLITTFLSLFLFLMLIDFEREKEREREYTLIGEGPREERESQARSMLSVPNAGLDLTNRVIMT